MDPREYKRLASIARQKGCSVGELIRAAVREKYLGAVAHAEEAVREICELNVPVGDWTSVERDIAGAHDSE